MGMKTLVKKVWGYITHPKMAVQTIQVKRMHGSYGKKMDDAEYVKRLFKIVLGYELDLENPKTFSEKLQWLKLYAFKPEYTVMADKYRMREYVAERIGEGHTIPLLGVWDDPEEIDFDKLPDRFVLKCNHNSGLGMCICRDKSKLDIAKVKRELKKGIEQDYYLTSRERPYKDIKRKIIAEEYLEDDTTKELRDYKFFVINGSVKIFYITSGFKAGDRRTDFFDMDLNHLDIRDCDEMAEIPPAFPQYLEKMIKLAEELAEGIPQLRVDFYEVNGHIYVGEFTFYYYGGCVPFRPKKWDAIWGEWLELPPKN